MRTSLLGLMALLGSGPALAQEMVGDFAAGEARFAARCGTCHVIENEAGEVLAGSSSENEAPAVLEGGANINLYGLAGRVPGSLPDAIYSDLMVVYGETGAVWDEANFVAFVPNPSAFLTGATGETGFSRMPSGRVRKEQQAHDLWAYLATFSPAEGEGAVGEAITAAPADGDTASE